jgi:hypothetical protein
MGLSDCRVQAMLAVSDLDRARRFYGTEHVMEPGQFSTSLRATTAT